jgi:hypothetical protein
VERNAEGIIGAKSPWRKKTEAKFSESNRMVLKILIALQETYLLSTISGVRQKIIQEFSTC